MKELKSSFEISECLKSCVQKEKEIIAELDKNKLGLFDLDKEAKKMRVCKLKRQLKVLQMHIRTCLYLFETCTTFERESFLPFLKGYLALSENKKYYQMEFVEEHNQPILISAAVFNEKRNVSYDIITTDDNYAKILMNKNTETVENLLSVCVDGKYVCLQESEKYTLLKGTELASTFKTYPHLFSLAMKIVDIRLANPEIDDRTLLSTILTELYTSKIVR